MQQQWFESLNQQNLSDEQLNQAKEQLTNINSAMAEFRTAAAHIRADARLSKEGQAADLGALAQQAADRLEHVVDLGALDRRIAELGERLRPQAPDTDPVLQHLREREVRDLLRDKDELEVIGLYEELAVNARDDLSMRAIESAPASFPLISDPAILEGGKRARAERQSPDAAKTLRQLKAMRSTLESALNTARAELNLPADDVVVRIARGEVV